MSAVGEHLAWLWAALGLGVEILALSLVPFVLLRRREPSSTIAWILALVFLPLVGAVLFLLHGRDRVRWPAKKKRAADAVVTARLHAARVPPDAEAAIAQLPPGDQRIFQVCAGLGALNEITGGNRVELYADGLSAVDAIERAIDGAKSSVLAQFYLLRADATGARFRDKLAAAAARGVEVRLLVDAYGCFWIPKRWYRPLKRAGVKVIAFLPLAQAVRLPMNLRNHRKIVVVDGNVGFTGGVNIGDEYVGGSAREPAWRDTFVRIEGPAVASLASAFLRDWHFMTGSIDVDPRFFPDERVAGPATVAVVPSGPDSPVESIHRTFFAAITWARQRIWITTPYFVPDRALTVALETAALRGVDVQIIVPHKSNHKVTHEAGRSWYAELLESGVAIHEYLPGMIHAKTMLVDDHISLVGSANMDLRSFRLNFELHALVLDANLARALEATFTRDQAQCRHVDLDQWLARPWRHKLREGAARLVSPIL